MKNNEKLSNDKSTAAAMYILELTECFRYSFTFAINDIVEYAICADIIHFNIDYEVIYF